MSEQQYDADNFLMGGKLRSAAFRNPGDTIGGPIVAKPEVKQQTSYVRPGSGQTPKPMFWDDGSPRLQLVVQVQTDQRDPQDAEDDGVRALYVKYRMQNAVRNAVRAAGAKGLEVGGHLAVTFTHADGPAENDAKNYTAAYRPPVANPAADAFLGATAPVSPAPAAVVPQQAAPPAPARQLVSVGGGQVDLAALDPATRALVETQLAQAGSGQPPF